MWRQALYPTGPTTEKWKMGIWFRGSCRSFSAIYRWTNCFQWYLRCVGIFASVVWFNQITLCILCVVSCVVANIEPGGNNWLNNISAQSKNSIKALDLQSDAFVPSHVDCVYTAIPYNLTYLCDFTYVRRRCRGVTCKRSDVFRVHGLNVDVYLCIKQHASVIKIESVQMNCSGKRKWHFQVSSLQKCPSVSLNSEQGSHTTTGRYLIPCSHFIWEFPSLTIMMCNLEIKTKGSVCWQRSSEMILSPPRRALQELTQQKHNLLCTFPWQYRFSF